MRKVIFHYHLFKNAGTSLDKALRSALNNKAWDEREFPQGMPQNRKAVAAWVKQRRDIKLFSSHTAYLPPPRLWRVKILPVLFLRHPVDRIASVYEFERRQTSKELGAVLASHTDFRGYIETRLAVPLDRQCRNFQAQRLAFMYRQHTQCEWEMANRAMSVLHFVGVVDRFEQSLAVLERWLTEEGVIDQKLAAQWENAGRDRDASLEQRLEKVRQQLGESLYEELLEANRSDLELYQKACDRLV